MGRPHQPVDLFGREAVEHGVDRVEVEEDRADELHDYWMREACGARNFRPLYSITYDPDDGWSDSE
jgi:hypothetical protein